jgi:molecular chaperone GrpE
MNDENRIAGRPPAEELEGGPVEEEKLQDKEGVSNEVEHLKAEVTELQTKLSEKEKEASAHYDRFLREKAELENFKKRMQREKTEALRFANEPLVHDLLPVIDNLERAVEHAQGGGNGQPLVEGVKLVLQAFLDVLDKHGVSRVEARGEVFDPTRHEALAQVESSAHSPNTVVEEHHKGYFLHDRLLRPALVTVAKLPVGDDGGEEGSGEKNEVAGEEEDG